MSLNKHHPVHLEDLHHFDQLDHRNLKSSAGERCSAGERRPGRGNEDHAGEPILHQQHSQC